MLKMERLEKAKNTIAFAATCVMAIVLGWSPQELVWGLCWSGTIAGTLGVVVPFWVLIFWPSLEAKLFPDEKLIQFSPIGRVFSALFIALVLAGPFVGFMIAFLVFLADRIPLADLSTNSQQIFYALQVVWPVCVITTVSQLHDSTKRIFAGDGTAVVRPYGLIVKMTLIVFLSNFGFGRWSIIPYAWLMFVSEDAVLQWVERRGQQNNAVGESG